MDNIYLNLFFVAILIALTAFFVASEFAIVKIRSTRIDQLIQEGQKSAVLAKKVTTNLDEYLSACQLGITITALGIGRLGEPTFERMLHPVIESLPLASGAIVTTVSIVVSFMIMTFLHVVIGELAPKTLAIQKAERITLLLAPPLRAFYFIMYPLIWFLNGAARLLTRSLGLKSMSEHDVTHTEEELRLILSDSYRGGEINQSEFKYVSKIFEFDNRVAKEIMVPRTEISAISIDEPMNKNLEFMRKERFTRFPVVDGDKDNILGVINVREVLTDIVSPDVTKEIILNDYIRPVISVIESIPVNDLLIEMQKQQTHMAILFDEYGGTAGLITAEDIIEEIVGEINDEFDVEEDPQVQKISDDHYIIEGKTLISDVNKLLHLELDETDVDTIGGWLLTEKYDIAVNEAMEYDQFTFTVIEFDNHQVKRIEIMKQQSNPQLAEQLAST
ncbi:hemolysin family protein [Alkalicoccobacillus porphyridii]|uniref:HlyC/CorC family transporter n=1 Tax=Alkalicoccobacillus porphyridii TaxID=2597270 RepID=A0A553ZUP7_9BACI|nr:hemolysin family protein [Alkalicoccobacillus porphyridii]TSB45210.1 HlyC/CorC family transporter [Alkalicoccobacillus porphyridii]